MLSLWHDEAAVRALDTSASYRRTATMIMETGLLRAVSAAEAYEIHAGVVHDAAAMFRDVV